MVVRTFALLSFCLLSVNAFSKYISKISDEFYIEKFSDRLYAYQSYHNDEKWGRFTCNGMILITEPGKVWLYDTPMDDSLTAELVRWINNELSCEIEVLVPNHFHADCIGGLEVIREYNPNVYVFANKMTYELLPDKYKDPAILFILFEDIGPFELAEHYYFGAGHSEDNIVVWFPKEKVLFGGCMVKAAAATSLGNIADANLKKWPRTIKKVRRRFKHVEKVVPGHGEIGSRELFANTLKLLSENKKNNEK